MLLWAPKKIKVLVFGHFLIHFPLVSHQSWFTCQCELILEVCRTLASETQCLGHFGPQNRSFRSSVIFSNIFHSFHIIFWLTCFFGGTPMCISIMCPGDSLSGSGVLVATELARPLGLLYSGLRDEYVTGVIYRYFPSTATSTARETRGNNTGQIIHWKLIIVQTIQCSASVNKSIRIYWTLSGVSLHFVMQECRLTRCRLVTPFLRHGHLPMLF